jgi:SulP family sulfate permease
LAALVIATRPHLAGDFLAGLIVAVLLVPQSMAYAMLAGAPPVLGLYAGSVPLFVYLFFGSSKHLSVGPVSIVSLLAFAGVGAYAEPNSPHYLVLLSTLAGLVGGLLIVLGLLRAGRCLDRISLSVIRGFTSAAAIVICMQQLGALAGIDLPREERMGVLLLAFAPQLPFIHPISAGIGLFSLLVLHLLHKVLPFSVGPLVVVMLSACLVKRFDLYQTGVEIVGAIPSGLPELTWNTPSIPTILALFPTACAIAFISFFESYAIASSIAAKERYPLNANRELIGLGAANVASSLVGSIPVAGAFSRTAVNYGSGGRTKLSSFVTGLLLCITVLYFTQPLFFLPKAALAAVIVFSVFRLMDWRSLASPHAVGRAEYSLLVVTFFSTLLIGVAQGLLIGIILSFFIKK